MKYRTYKYEIHAQLVDLLVRFLSSIKHKRNKNFRFQSYNPQSPSYSRDGESFLNGW